MMSATDCEALLMTTLQRGWRVDCILLSEVGQGVGVWLKKGELEVFGDSTQGMPRPAYREAVTRACVQAAKVDALDC